MKTKLKTLTTPREDYLIKEIKSSLPNEIVAESFIKLTLGEGKASKYRAIKLQSALDCIENIKFSEEDPSLFLRRLNELNSEVSNKGLSQQSILSFQAATKNLFLSMEENSSLKIIKYDDWEYFLSNFILNPNDRIYVLYVVVQ